MKRHILKNPFFIALLLMLTLSVSWLGYSFAIRYFINKTAIQGQSTLRLATAGLRGELSRYEPLPELIADNKDIRNLLADPTDRYQVDMVNQQLKQITKNVAASVIYLIDKQGLTIASSNFDTPISFVNRNFDYRPYFQTAIKGGEGRYFALGSTSLKRGYYFAAPVHIRGEIVGVTVVKINVDGFETAWRGNENEIIVTDEYGIIFMSSREEWLFRSIKPVSSDLLFKFKSTRQYPVDRISELPITNLSQNNSQNDLLTNKDKGELISLPFAGDNKEFIFKHMEMKDAGWTVHILSPTSGARAQAYAVLLSIILSTLLAILLLAFLSQRRARIEEIMQTQKEAHEQLEKRVANRTKDLNEVNAKLLEEVEERVAAERRLRKTQEDLIQAGKLAALGQMSAALSHELNQPLAAVKSYADNAEAYLERERPEEAKENIKRISELTDRMAAISKHLRNFARKPKEQLGPIPLATVVNDAIEIMSGKLRSRSASISVDVPGNEIWVHGGQVRLQQVLVNLISNALDVEIKSVNTTEASTPEVNTPKVNTPKIEIRAGVNDGRVKIEVRDNGKGLEEDIINQIFDPFFTTKGINKGLGLGLSISYNIIRDFGGTLSARNHPDGGAIFTIELNEAERVVGAAE